MDEEVMVASNPRWFEIQDQAFSTIERMSYAPPMISMPREESSFSNVSPCLYFLIAVVLGGLFILGYTAAKKLDSKFNSSLKVSSVLFLVLSLYSAFFIFLVWNEPFALIPERLREGVFGDSFGTLNALFSGLAFSGVLITLLIQRKDLSEARDQNARQQTESQFYSMLNLQQQIVQAFDLHRHGANPYIIQGRDCFRDWSRKLGTRYDEMGESHAHADSIERSLAAYEKVMSDHQGDLGLYFRSLYSIFRFIEDAHHSDKQSFALVVRSLLSDYELVLLFYNCLSHKGKKFKKYANSYALFDNLNVTLLQRECHVVYMDKEAYGKNEEALRILHKAQDQ